MCVLSKVATGAHTWYWAQEQCFINLTQQARKRAHCWVPKTLQILSGHTCHLSSYSRVKREAKARIPTHLPDLHANRDALSSPAKMLHRAPASHVRCLLQVLATPGSWFSFLIIILGDIRWCSKSLGFCDPEGWPRWNSRLLASAQLSPDFFVVGIWEVKSTSQINKWISKQKHLNKAFIWNTTGEIFLKLNIKNALTSFWKRFWFLSWE